MCHFLVENVKVHHISKAMYIKEVTGHALISVHSPAHFHLTEVYSIICKVMYIKKMDATICYVLFKNNNITIGQAYPLFPVKEIHNTILVF